MQLKNFKPHLILAATSLALGLASPFAQAKPEDKANCAQFLGSPDIVSRLGDLQNMLLGPVDKMHRAVPSPFSVIDELLDRPDEWTEEARHLLLEVTALSFRTAHLHDFQKADLLRLAGEHGLYSPELVQLVTNEISQRPVLRFISDGSPNSGQYLLAYLDRLHSQGWRPKQNILLQLREAQSRTRLAFSQRDKDNYPYVFADWSQETVPSETLKTSSAVPFLVEDFTTALKLFSNVLDGR